MSVANDGHIPPARTASKEQLRRRLTSAPAPWLAEALENPELGPSELLLLLRNPTTPTAVLEEIGTNRDWMGHHELRRGLVRHRHAPPTLANRLLDLLFWKDWCDIAAHPGANPRVRRQAERLLRNCIGDLGLGERINLARRVTRALIPVFLADRETRVIQALLANPRLVEMDLVRLLNDRAQGANVLRCVAEHPTWGQRRELQLLLLRRPELGVQAALRIARKMHPRDLRRLLQDDKVPQIVRVGIERRLRGGS